MKQAALLLSAAVFLFSVSGCNSGSSPSGSSSVEPSATPEPTAQEPLTDAEVKKMYSAPDDYKGAFVELSGIVFGTVEYGDDAIYFQMWGDPENNDLNTVVAYPDPDFELENNQYVKLTGFVTGEFTGTNAFGGQISAPTIAAETLEISSYQDVVAPTLATATAAVPTVDQLGYSVTVQKVELAENETRLYVSAANNGSSDFSIYSFNMIIIQNGRQYEEQYNFNADYPQLQDNILPGITTEGVVLFPPLEDAPFQLIIKGSSGDWDEELDNYIFDLSVQ